MVGTRFSTQDPRNCPGPEDRSLPSLGQTLSDPLLGGKTAHNVGGLACILRLTNPHNQSSYVPRNVAPREWCPPTWVEKAPSHPDVLQAELVKIVTEILFGNAPLANHETIVLAADHRPGH